MVSETSESRNVLSYLHLLIDISNGDLVCLIFDKRDALDFGIVNFPDVSGNISTILAYCSYISQLTTYNWAVIVMTTFILNIPFHSQLILY